MPETTYFLSTKYLEMKRVFTFMGLLACFISNGQNIDDVLRYGSENLQGTARFQAMGGAFGALGGDLSSLNINPAGSSVFNNSLLTFSATYYDQHTDSDYRGSLNSSNSNTLDINQVGGALVFKNTDINSQWKKFTVAVNYDLVQNFEGYYVSGGTGTEGIDNYFLDYADGIPLDPLKLRANETIGDAYLDIGATNGLGFAGQQAFLGFQAGIIEPVVDEADNTAYYSNATYSELNQDFRQTVSGYNSKFVVNGSTQYGDNIYMGASLNFHTVLYDRLNSYREDYFTSDSELRSVAFDELLRTEGTGFSFSAGAIAKINHAIRLGASYQSPTWYRLSDSFSQGIDSNYPNKDASFSYLGLNDFNLFDYQIKTPSKLTGSIAAVFGLNGLLSFDYSYQDMSKAELRPTSDIAFAEENRYISEVLGGVSSFRVGGEYKIKRVSLRGGYRFEQSPYADGNYVGDLTALSGGIGINFGASKLDLAVSRSEQDVLQYFFSTGISTPAVLTQVNTNVTLSYTLNF